MRRFLDFPLSFLLISAAAPAVFAGGAFGTGARYERWESNFERPFNGWEAWMPLHLQFTAGDALQFYAESRWGTGNYESSLGVVPHTDRRTAFSDTVAGGEASFMVFGQPSLFSLEFNLPTGDEEWEARQMAANIPTEFVPSRYRGRGFGVSALFGMVFPGEGTQTGAALGYLFSGSFNPDQALVANDLKIGDSVFLAWNRIRASESGRETRWRIAFLHFRPSERDGRGVFQLGQNVNFSYGRFRAEGISWELAAELYAKSKRREGEELKTEAHHSLGPRFTLLPAWSRGNFSLLGHLKWVAPNGYPEENANFDAGGWRFGLEPALRLGTGSRSSLRLSTSWDSVIDRKGGLDAAGNRIDVTYHRWTFGSEYEVRW